MLLLDSSVCGLFKWRQFEPEVILLAIGWYLRFSLSYRDVEELLAERGLSVDHVTVWRWVQRYAPELERRLRSRLKPTNDSWRVDETYIRVKGKWVYLYRAVDSSGATIDFLLSAKRDAAAAERFLTKALGGENHPAPRVINTNKDVAYPPAYRATQSRSCAGGKLLPSTRAIISTMFWNRIIGVPLWTHRHTVTGSARKPRSASNSSNSRYESEKRKYQPTARRITSGSNCRHLKRPQTEDARRSIRLWRRSRFDCDAGWTQSAWGYGPT